MLKNISGYILDLDSYIFSPNRKKSNLIELVNTLNKNNLSYVFLTNSSTKTSEEIQKEFLVFGLAIPKKQIITVANITRNYLKENFQDKNVKVYGSKFLKNFIYEKFRVGSKTYDVIVVGHDNKISLSDLTKIRKFIEEGKKVVFTNPKCDGSCGYFHECSEALELLSPHLSEEPTILAKPAKCAFDFAIKKIKIPSEFTVIISDSIDDENIITLKTSKEEKIMKFEKLIKKIKEAN